MDERRARRWTVGMLVALLALGLAFYFGNREPPASPVGSRQTLATAPRRVEAYFTVPVESGTPLPAAGLDHRVVQAIDAAQATVDAAFYDLNLWTVRDSLIEAHRRGVQVRLVVEGDNRAQTELADIAAAGIPIVSDDRPPLMHHKFVVIDGVVVWTGSMNYTFNGVYRNDNNLLRLQSSDLARDYTQEFEEMFKLGRFGQLSRHDTPYPFLAIGDTAVEVAFAPEDGAQAVVLRWLDGATRSVELLAFILTADPVADALLRAQARGADVRGVVEADHSDDLGSDVDRLRQAGLDVRLDTNPDTMHHKVILIDGTTVITGSYNFTRSADERNDENLIVLVDSQVAGEFSREFERLYQRSLR